MNGADDSQQSPTYVERSSGKPKIIIIFIVLLFLVIAVLVGLYFFGGMSKKSSLKVSLPIPTQVMKPPTTPSTASISASASPSGAMTASSSGKQTSSAMGTGERSKLSVAILNGSGTPGAAKGIATYLGGLGYTIAVVGNADAFTYTNITIKVKKSMSNYLPQLKKDIAANAPSTPITTSIDDTISSDAAVIVGK